MDDQKQMSKPIYEAGDCVVRHLGKIELKDGQVFRGAIVEFPAGPPSLPLSAVWDGSPVLMTLKPTTRIPDLMAAVVADEREACAKIADGEMMEVRDDGEERIVKSIAEQIRARSTPAT